MKGLNNLNSDSTQFTAQQKKFVLDAITARTGWVPPSIDEKFLIKIFECLTCKEELRSGRTDNMGRWSHEFHANASATPWNTPRVDEDIAVLCGIPTDPSIVPRWPNGSPFALCLTHDIDIVSRKSYLQKFARRLRRSLEARGPRQTALINAAGALYRWIGSIGQSDPLGHYEDWTRLENKYGFNSTYYVFAPEFHPEHVFDAEYKFQDPVEYDGVQMTTGQMFRELLGAGVEIGLHGSIESAQVPGMLADQKHALEIAIGQTVCSTRQHYLMYNPLVTPGLQANAGFTCDSTLGYPGVLGFRSGTCHPHWCWNWVEDNPYPLLELPLAIMDVNLMGLTIDQAVAKCVRMMDAVQNVGGCLTVNWHPNYLNGPEWDVYSTLLQEAYHRGAWGRGVGEVAAWWINQISPNKNHSRLMKS